MALNPYTEINAVGVLKNLTQYLDIRFDYAARLNPKMRQVEMDLKWHQLDATRHLLLKSKPLGEVRFHVADIMVSYDVDKKRMLYSPKGQIAIMGEVLTSQKDDLHAKGGGQGIRDLATLYTAIDPWLKPILELMQTWTWWDLPDSADMTLYDQSLDRFRQLSQGQIDDKLKAYYTQEMKSEKSPDMTMQGILDFEFYRMESVVLAVEKRRSEEPNYEQIIARESSGSDNAAHPLVTQLAQHVRAYDSIKATGRIEPSLVDYYSKAIQCASTEVTPQRVLDFEERYLANAKQDVVLAIQKDKGEGEPYNFKLRQYVEIRKMLENLRAQVKPRPKASSKDEGGRGGDVGF